MISASIITLSSSLLLSICDHGRLVEEDGNIVTSRMCPLAVWRVNCVILPLDETNQTTDNTGLDGTIHFKENCWHS